MDTAAVIIQLVNVNDPPSPKTDSYTVDSLDSLAVLAPGVLANDVDPDGDPLSSLQVSSPTHGMLTLDADGSFRYTPDDGYVGDDSFTYRTTDGREESGLATVTIHVLPLDPAPGDGSGDDGGENDDDGEDSDAEESPIEDIEPTPLPDSEPEPTSSTDPSDQGATQPIGPVDPEVAADVVAEEIKETSFLFQASKTGRAIDTEHDAANKSSIRRSGRHNDHGTEAAATELDVIQREYGTLLNQLDTFQQDVNEQLASEQTYEVFVAGTTAVSVTGLTIGYVIWLLRGGTLLASMVSTLPAWCSFDPLPVLGTFDESNDRERDHDDDSLESLMTRSNDKHQTREEPRQTS